MLVRSWNKQSFAYVNLAQIRSWNQPTLSKEGCFLLKETPGVIGGVRTHDWQASADHESDVLPAAPRRIILIRLVEQ